MRGELVDASLTIYQLTRSSLKTLFAKEKSPLRMDFSSALSFRPNESNGLPQSVCSKRSFPFIFNLIYLKLYSAIVTSAVN